MTIYDRTVAGFSRRELMKILEKVSVPDLPARIGGSLVVEAGKPGGSTD